MCEKYFIDLNKNLFIFCDKLASLQTKSKKILLEKVK